MTVFDYKCLSENVESTDTLNILVVSAIRIQSLGCKTTHWSSGFLLNVLPYILNTNEIAAQSANILFIFD